MTRMMICKSAGKYDICDDCDCGMSPHGYHYLACNANCLHTHKKQVCIPTNCQVGRKYAKERS